MSTRRNNIRFDLSDYLIHFVRPVDLLASDAPEFPEHMGWGNINEDVRLSPFFILRCIVRHGRIWATWSVRGADRTIYGPRPAVCFTEMPLAAFVQSSRARAARGEKMSPYGLVFPKEALFRLGSRPVIYALSRGASPTVRTDRARMLPPAVLAEAEQYRYVAYDPSRASGPDWTHEREWRWPGVARTPDPDGLPPGSWEDLPGLDFYAGRVRGIGAIVRSARQARLLTRDFLRLVDRGTAEKPTFRFVLTTDGLPPLEKLWRPEDVQAAIDTNIVSLDSYFVAKASDKALIAKFRAIARAVAAGAPAPEYGEAGGCWLWIHDNTHPLVRALHRDGRVLVSKDGRYLAAIPEFDDDRALRQREALTQQLADEIEKAFGASATFFSVLRSNDFEKLPFYNGHVLGQEIHTNGSWNEEDY